MKANNAFSHHDLYFHCLRKTCWSSIIELKLAGDHFVKPIKYLKNAVNSAGKKI